MMRRARPIGKIFVIIVAFVRTDLPVREVLISSAGFTQGSQRAQRSGSDLNIICKSQSGAGYCLAGSVKWRSGLTGVLLNRHPACEFHRPLAGTMIAHDDSAPLSFCSQDFIFKESAYVCPIPHFKA
jgi:hypothetical protein